MKPDHYSEVEIGSNICTVCGHCDSHPFNPHCYKHEFDCEPWGACEDWKRQEWTTKGNEQNA